MRRLALLFTLAACSDPGTADSPDAPPPSPAHAMLVQQVATGLQTTDHATIALAPTRAGSTVIVVAGFEAADPTWLHRAVIGSVELSPDSGHVAIGCGRTFEFWSLRDVAAGSTSIDLTLRQSATMQAVAFEVGGLSRFPLYSSQNNYSTSAFMPPPPVMDAQTYTNPGEFMIGAVMTCGTLTGVADTGFTAVPLTTGTEAAVVLPAGSGLFGPHWMFDGPDWYQMTISYR